jgi:hypothetical protein
MRGRPTKFVIFVTFNILVKELKKMKKMFYSSFVNVHLCSCRTAISRSGCMACRCIEALNVKLAVKNADIIRINIKP